MYCAYLLLTDPSRPPTPRVAMSHGEAVKSFSVEVYKTDDQFGPIRCCLSTLFVHGFIILCFLPLSLFSPSLLPSLPLYSSSTSHYTVFAVPVYRGPSAPRSAPYTPSFPYSELVSKSVSAHLATEAAAKPIPFIVGQYEASTLPDKLVFDGSWRKRAFKPETHYAFVVAAYSKTKVSCVSAQA